MKLQSKIISPLEKVFYDDRFSKFKKYPQSSALIGEKHNFVVVYQDTEFFTTHYCIQKYFVKVKSDIKESIKVYTVEHVPAVFAAPIYEEPDNFLRQYPGLYPDLLVETNENIEHVIVHRVLNTLWVEIDTENLPAGTHKITVEFTDAEGNIFSSCTHKLNVINARLPEQTLKVTHWMHTDCIADYYNLKMFSEKHWEAIESYIKMYVELGNNMLYTPMFTPPLDTAEGGERTTVQLIDVELCDGKYTFNFEKFRRWINLARKCGVKYFEMNHLFTQWGAKHAPKIIATVDGKKKKIFGWETDAHGSEYESFLAQFMSALLPELEALNMKDCTVFHISDEPFIEHFESYKACSAIIRKYLAGYKIMDAMANIEYYNEGLVDIPIPYVKECKHFFAANPNPRFVYYCGADKEFMGRAIAMPSSRNRIAGVHFYTNNIDGFLHWGFNFYNARSSVKHIDPYFITDADKQFCAGDSYLVYPGENFKVHPSIRAFVFRDALQDMRALQLCEALCGRDAVMSAIASCNRNEIPDILTTPSDPYFTLNLRETINNMIQNEIK
ncbi:MAG: DUF4091 domain-containing protein [Ruminococcaceae bacterium]|nr:DUF4091 domain-containing protein [Oscillospiraceae bacterium]